MSSELVTKSSTCRLCNGLDLTLIIPMKPSPVADAFILPSESNEEQPLFPLDLYQCQSCGHAQNIDVVNPSLLFSDYIYTTSSSLGLVKHFENYANEVTQSFEIQENSLAVEIGSNDGTLLRFLKEKGMRVIGVDPAKEIAAQATASGIPTFPDFFNSKLAEQIVQENGKAQLVLANNVYAHSDSLRDITKGIEVLLDQEGIFVFEVSYLLDIVDRYLFDTIYHEHLSYHSIQPFMSFFESLGLELFDVQKVSTKGGSMRCFVQKKGGVHQRHSRVNQMLEIEDQRKLHSPEIFESYVERIQARKNELLQYLDEAKKQGKKVVGYGASTTVTTLMYQFELQDRLDFLVDDNETKHGRLSPGAHLEVKPSSALYDIRPDIVIILAWQYAKPILNRHAQFLEEGGTFVVPLPQLEIISNQTVGV